MDDFQIPKSGGVNMQLRDYLVPQQKSKFKAGLGVNSGKFKFFTSSPIQSKYINEYIYEEEALIFGTGGNASIHYCNEKFSTSTDCVVMYAKNNANLKLIYLYLKTYIYLLESGFKGAGLKHISKDYILEIEFNMPEKSRQHEIVEKMDTIDQLICMRKAQLDKLNVIVASRFIELFGDCKTNPKQWKTLRLDEVADVGSSKRVFVEELKKEGIPFYRGTEVGALAEGKTITPELFITPEHYKELCKATGAPRVGDLLMPSICPDGRIWVVNTDAPFYFKDGRVLWVHNISGSLNPVFLLYSLRDRIMTDYLSIASGTTFAEIKIFSLKASQVFDVPMDLQNEFASFVEQTDKLKFEI